MLRELNLEAGGAAEGSFEQIDHVAQSPHWRAVFTIITHFYPPELANPLQLVSTGSSDDSQFGPDPMPISAILHQAQTAHQAGQLAEALRQYEAAVDLNPLEYSAWCQGACVALEMGSLSLLPLALSWAQQATQLRPKEAYAHYVLGLAHQKANDGLNAIRAYEQAVVFKPRFYQAQTNLGVAYNALRMFEQARLSFEAALAIEPHNAVALNNLGVTLKALGESDAALESFDRAIALDPQYLDAWVNRGFTQSECMHIEHAIADYQQVLAHEPTHVAAQFNLSLLQLMQGDFSRGWAGYEARHHLPMSETAPYKDVAINSQTLSLLTLGSARIQGLGGAKPLIEVTAEQGFGDVIQFCRYVEVLAGLGFRVRLKAPKTLHPLLSSLRGLESLVEADAERDPHALLSVAMMSLPHLVETQLTSIPANTPYLKADTLRAQYFEGEVNRLLKQALPGEVERKMRIGVVWSGGFRAEMPQTWGLNARRNIPLKALEPLGQLEAHFFTLQKGEPAQSELLSLRESGWRGPDFFDLTPLLTDFADTAALMMQLDLILSVDTACAHLAGALGQEVWILNRYDACWRWMRERADSPWYPSAKLYRQSQPHDWASVLAEVFTDLSTKVSSFGSTVQSWSGPTL